MLTKEVLVHLQEDRVQVIIKVLQLEQTIKIKIQVHLLEVRAIQIIKEPKTQLTLVHRLHLLGVRVRLIVKVPKNQLALNHLLLEARVQLIKKQALPVHKLLLQEARVQPIVKVLKNQLVLNSPLLEARVQQIQKQALLIRKLLKVLEQLVALNLAQIRRTRDLYDYSN